MLVDALGDRAIAVLRAVADRDVTATAAALEGAAFTVSPLGWTQNDPAAAAAALADVWTALPDLVVRTVRTYPGQDLVAIELVAEGTFRAPFGDLAPTGRHVQIHGRAVARGVEGRLTDVSVAFNLDAALEQLGIRRTAAAGKGGGVGLLGFELADEQWWQSERTLRVEEARTKAKPQGRRRVVAALTALALLGAASAAAVALTRRNSGGPPKPTALVTQPPAPTASLTPPPTVTATASAQPIQPQQPVRLDSTLLFALDSATLRAQALPALDALAARIKAANRAGTVTVVGYTDNLGTVRHAQELSQARAAAVAAVLRDQLRGLPLQIKAQGAGMSRPVAPNTSEANRAKNRRVEVTFTTR